MYRRKKKVLLHCRSYMYVFQRAVTVKQILRSIPGMKFPRIGANSLFCEFPLAFNACSADKNFHLHFDFANLGAREICKIEMHANIPRFTVCISNKRSPEIDPKF